MTGGGQNWEEDEWGALSQITRVVCCEGNSPVKPRNVT